jgi:hypothetical protein
MSTPNKPHPDPSDGPEQQSSPPQQAGAQPPTESEPAPSAAPSAQGETADTDQPTVATPHPGQQASFGMPPPAGQAGHYVFVPAGQRRGFGPGFGRFVRNRATHLVAAVVVGALVGGGTVAIVDNAANQHRDAPVFRQIGPGGPFDGNRFPGFGSGRGGQGFGN